MKKNTKLLTPQDIKKLAKLANLQINEPEIAKYQQQLSASLDYVNNLNDVNTAGVPDTFFTTRAVNVWQDDEIDPQVTLPQSEVLKNAKQTRNGYFVVKRIL